MPAPDKLTIDTPEQIGLDFALATLGSRFLALLFDTALQGLAIALIVVLGIALRVTLEWLGPGFFVWLAAGMLLAGFVVYYGYFLFFEIRWSGQTPGKRLVGIRTMQASGRPLTVQGAVLRNLLRIADQLPGFYAVGIISIFVTERSQRLGDLAADTVVIHERTASASRFGGPTARAREVAARYGAHRLTTEEIAIVDTFLRRRDDLVGVRELRAQQVAAVVRRRLDVAGADVDDETFLEQVAAEYREYR